MLTILNILFPVVTFPYVARTLAPDGVGSVQFIFSFALYFSTMAALGIPIYGVKEIGKNRESGALSKVFSELFWIHLVSSVFGLIIYIGSILLFPDYFPHAGLYVAGGALVFFSFLNLDWFFSGMEKFGLITLRSFAVKLIGMVGVFLLVKDKRDEGMYLGLLVFAYLGNYFLNAFFAFREVKLMFRNLDFRKHIPHLFFILGTLLSATIYTTLDTVFLGFFANPHEVGIYTASIKLSKIAIPFTTALSTVMIPKVALAIKNSNDQLENSLLRRSFSFIALISFPIGMGLFLLRYELVYLFSGEAFGQAAEVMIFLSFMPFLIGFGHFFAFQVLVPNNLAKGMFISTLLGAVLFVALNFVLTPVYGSRGSAIVYFLTELIVTLTYVVFIPNRMRKILPWKVLLESAGVSLLFIPIVYFIRGFSLNALSFLFSSVVSCTLVFAFVQYYVFSNRLMIEVWDKMRKLVTRWRI